MGDTRCPGCGCTHWEVDWFSGGEHSAAEGRECQDCGHTWTAVLTEGGR